MNTCYVLNVKKAAPQTYLAYAKNVALKTVLTAIIHFAVLLNLILSIVRDVLLKRKERKKPEMKVCPVVTSYQKYRSGEMSKSLAIYMAEQTTFRKDPTKPIMICSTCAKLKHLIRAKGIWMRQARCHYCLEVTFTCQIIMYIETPDALEQ
jgi:hypothetical protein